MISVSDRALADRLEAALAARALTLAFQPKIRLATGAVSGVEAVSRWHDPALGEVPPTRFVAIAEQAGLIDDLTDWLLDEAFAQWGSWAEQGLAPRLAINISALSLRDIALPDRIQRLAMQAGLGCERLTVEVTESARQNAVPLLDTLTRFRLKGIGVSLDDFGTGYSSLVQLRQLPYSEVKVDRCFVHDAAVSRESRLIVKAVVDLAHGMGLSAIAEGVEDEATLALLEDLGCDEAQGFLIARPMPGAAFAEWLLASGRRLDPSSPGARSPASAGPIGYTDREARARRWEAVR